MDFGSSHVYAGAPYYSDVPNDNEKTLSTTSPKVQQTIYESVNEMRHPAKQEQQPSQASDNNHHAYDPVCFEGDGSAGREYDLVPYEPELDSQHTPHVTTNTKPAPPKKSLSTTMLHKAKNIGKITIMGRYKKKTHKSESSISEPIASNSASTIVPSSQSICNKPLPPIPGSSPALPPPRLPPKPTMYRSQSITQEASLDNNRINSIISNVPGSTQSNTLPKPLKPAILHPKPLYPVLPNQYDMERKFEASAKVASAPPASDILGSVLSKTPSAPCLTASMVKRDIEANKKEKNIYAAADTNVVSVNLGILENSNNSMVWAMPPYRCVKCQAVLHHHALSGNKEPGFCRFCNISNENILEAALPLVGNESDITYVLNQSLPTTSDDPIIVFCIDTSGSMCVNLEIPHSSHDHFMSRLQAVKEGIIAQLHSLKQSRPKARVAIITFSNIVTLLGDGSPGQYMAFDDAQLYDTDFIKTTASNVILPGHIVDTHNQLLRTVNLLKEHGGTALGPALFLSVALASRKCGSKVIVCTDGRANVGVGSLESESDYKMCHHFYKETSEFGMESGAVVSILSIEGTDCRLVELGKVADRTAGKVKIATGQNITEEIADIILSKLMATQVEVNIVTQKELCFQDSEENWQSRVKSFVGNATSDTEVTFKYGIQESEKNSPQSALFQLQVRYLLPNGCMCLRVITQARPVTENRILAEHGLNPAVVGTYASQLASKLVLDGDLRDAKLTTDSHKKLIRRALSIRSTYSTAEGVYHTPDDERIYGSVCNHMTELDEEIARVADSIKPAKSPAPSTETGPPLPPRLNSTPGTPRNLSRSSSISSLSLPDVPTTPLPTREKLREAVEHCPDEVARKLYKHRNAHGKMFSAC